MYYSAPSQTEAEQLENGENMTEFDKNYSFFMVSDTVAELKEGVVQIQHLRAYGGHGNSQKTAQFDIKTGSIPELINVLEKYYKSVTVVGDPEHEKCKEIGEDKSIPHYLLDQKVDRLYNLVRPVYSVESREHNEAEGDSSRTLAEEVFYLRERIKRLEKTREECEEHKECTEKDEVSKEEHEKINKDETSGYSSAGNKVEELIKGVHLCVIPVAIRQLQEYYKKESDRIEKSNDEMNEHGKVATEEDVLAMLEAAHEVQRSLSDNNSKDKVLGSEEFVDRLFQCFDFLHDPEGAGQSYCRNKYEIWGKMVGTGAKFYAVIQAPSIKQARIEAEEKMKQWGCGKAFECGANLKT